jgi:hypothetical protein
MYEREGIVRRVFIEDADRDARCDKAKETDKRSEDDVRTLDASVVDDCRMVRIDELVIEHVCGDSGVIGRCTEEEA